MTITAAPPGEFTLAVNGRECTVRCTRALLSWYDEQVYLGTENADPYGLVLWPSAIALALELSQRTDAVRGRRVLELGAGVGLPGIAAAMLGARVVQTDRDERALALARENATSNGVTMEWRVADWTAWPDIGRHDWVIGSDILYRSTLHDQLHALLDATCNPGGTILISDPLRSASLKLLERMEAQGWSVRMNRWTIGDGEDARAIGVFELRMREQG